MTISSLRSPRSLVVALALLSVTTAGRLDAQQSRTIGAVDTTPIMVDFLAVGPTGAPITDLTPADLTVRISGKVRTIHALQLVRMPVAAASAAAAPAAPTPAATPSAEAAPAGLPAPYGTNARASHGAGRAIFLVIDNESMPAGSERPTKDAILHMLDQLSPDDQVALVTVPHGGVNVDLTSDLTKIRAAVALVVGAGTIGETSTVASERSRNSLIQFTAMMEQLAGAEQPSTFVLISQSLLGSQASATINTNASSNGTSSGGVTSTGVDANLTSDDFDHIAPAAAGARAQVFIVQPETGATTVSTAPVSRRSNASSTNTDPTTGLQNIAGASGGEMMQLALPGETALTRITRETSAYYVASLDPEPDDRTGTTHAIVIKTTRPDVTIRTRPTLFVAKAGAATKAGPKPMTPDDMIKTANPFTDLPLRVTGFAVRKAAAGDKMTVHAVVDPVDPSVHFTAVTFALVDPVTHKATLYRAVSQQLTAGSVIGLFEVPAGKYRLRAAATDSNGRAGAADYDLDAELVPGGPFKLSNVALGVMSQGQLQQKTEFSTEPEATVFCELYGGASGQQLALSIELAQTATGPAMDVDLKPQAGTTGEADKFAVVATVPLASLAPGDYVVRVKFGVADQPGGEVLRTLRKVAK